MIGGELLASKAIEAATSEKAQGLIKGLFGKAFEETGEMIADQVRLRRFKNQVRIFEKAQDYLKEKNIDPRKVSLKVLSPLLDYSSLEEDDDLQERWAKLVKNVLSKPLSTVLQQNSVEILNKISNEEALLLDLIYEKYIKGRIERAARINARKRAGSPDRLPESLSVNLFSFSISGIEKESSSDEIETQISNLVALGVLKYDIAVDVTANKSSDDPSDTDVDVDVDVTDYKNIRITQLGYTFVRLCTE